MQTQVCWFPNPVFFPLPLEEELGGAPSTLVSRPPTSARALWNWSGWGPPQPLTAPLLPQTLPTSLVSIPRPGCLLPACSDPRAGSSDCSMASWWALRLCQPQARP